MMCPGKLGINRPLLPRDLSRDSPGDTVGFVAGMAKHQAVGVLSRREGQGFFAGFIDRGGHREETRPAGPDTKRRCCDIEMCQCYDGIDGRDGVALRDMGDHEMRSAPADRIIARAPML